MADEGSTDGAADAELTRRIGAGGADGALAERRLCERFGPRIRVYGLRHLGDAHAASDLVQAVLLKVIEALRGGRVERPESLGAFVLGTCRHVTWDLRRGEGRQRAIAHATAILHQDVDPPPTSSADVIRLTGCLQRLAERDGLVIRMTFMEDRSADEIALRTGLTAGNVRVVRHRALAKLHACLEAEGAP